MLQIRSLKVLSLKPLSLDLQAGDCIVILGPSGSGKSMILRSIADLERAEGDVLLDGQSRMSMSGSAWRKKVRYVAAEPGWWAETPLEHFEDPDYARTQAKRLGLDEELLSRPISRLSTGERQRLAFVRALEDKPAVLLLDEPTGALDVAATGLVEQCIRDVLAEGAIVMMVSHDPEQVARVGGKEMRLQDGALQGVAS